MSSAEPPSPVMAPEAGVRARGSLVGIACLLTAVALLGWGIEDHSRTFLFAWLEALLVWCALGALAQVIGGNRTTMRQCVLLLAGAFLFTWTSYPAWQSVIPLESLPAATLKAFAFSLLGAAALLHFFANYAKLVLGADNRQSLNPSLPLARVAGFACAMASAAIFFGLSTSHYFGEVLGCIFAFLTLLLATETLARLAARFYQPLSQRTTPSPIGASLFLDLLGGSGRGLRELGGEMEKLLGVRLEEFWMVSFLARAGEAMLLAGIALAWLSSCLTAVPLGSRGVLVSFGRYSPDPLAPGLHVTLPWPLQEITLVPTERIREIALGFEQDMAGPVLWTQKHYVGEQNLLVGDGESLLTIDVPIEYRISDPVAFLTATSDPTSALKSLAQRDLIQAAQSRESFQIMTSDRAEIAAQLKQRVQQDADRLKLGIRVVFVALKDVHPPVDVAPAYEKVVSAEEGKEAAIDLANAYQASVLPDAQAAASRLVSHADATATQRVDQATGESGRFSLLALAEKEAPALFHIRWRYDALDSGLSAPAKIIVGLSGSAAGTYLDLRGGRDNSGPAPVQQLPPATPDRPMTKETIEH